MKLTRISAYYRYNANNIRVAEHLYTTECHVEAISRFRREFPELHNCICVAEAIEDKDQDYISACFKSGAI